MNKVMTWYGIEMKTMFDKSNSKIAELLLQGTNMGIIEGRKLLNNKLLFISLKCFKTIPVSVALKKNFSSFESTKKEPSINS